MMRTLIQPKLAPTARHTWPGEVIPIEGSRSESDVSYGSDVVFRGHALHSIPVEDTSTQTDAPGRSLPDGLRHKMETAFGADFSAVRIQSGQQAAHLDALAFAQGNAIHFAPGQYNPNSLAGQKLIGHELAHVLQQRRGQVSTEGGAVARDSGLERQADQLGDQAVKGGQAGMSLPRPSSAAEPAGAQASQLVGDPALSSHPAPVQLSERKQKGFDLGKSHSKNRGGKITSHKKGKGRTEDPRKSAAQDRKRQRMLTQNVNNSRKKK
jgi:hypothetical protein